MPVCSISHSSSPGSTLPERVAMTRPSSGVKPIVVSTERPSAIAHSDAPAPRWQLTRRRPPGGRAVAARGARPNCARARESRSGESASARARRLAARRSLAAAGRRGVKGGVEAGDGGDLRQLRRDGVQRRQRLRLMQRGEVGELAQRRLDLGVDPTCRDEALAAVHDPVPDRIGVVQAVG
jgi:hypothetical protein